jgi:hypothetical protein
MAIICPGIGLLFVQAPRTGCTAIERLLLDRFGGESLPPENILDPNGFIRIQRKHCSIRQLLAEGLVPAVYAEQFTTVTTVRNPYDSLVSLYVKKRVSYQELLKDPASWVHRVRGFVEDIEFCRSHSFEEWLTKRYAVGHIDRLLGRGRRSLYGRYTAGVAVVMRFERLQQDFDAVMRRLGIEGDVTIPSINATQHRTTSYQGYYTPEARRIVEYVFKPELEQYGYTFEGLAESATVSHRAESRG